MKTSRLGSALCIGIVVICLLAAGMAAVLHGKTLVEWWKPAGVCLAISVPIGLILKKPAAILSGIEKGMLNYIIGIVIAFALSLGLFYTINYYASISESSHIITAEIINRYSEERYKTRRVSRNTTVRGEKYHVYFMVAQLPDGRLKKIEISADSYRRIHIGQHLELNVETGFFHVPVIKNLPFAVRNTRR
ncbi:MAG: hypothetical protein K2H98_03030 [Duncaniella sp.]|nr:hypothetical protein [Duncaniella sp.]